MSNTLPTEATARKAIPLDRGLFKYFPDALCAVADLSRIGNEQHNPGQPLHWAKEKSTDHGDCLLRHQMEVGTFDTDKVRHATKVAWRALAQLQIELDASKELEARSYVTALVAAKADVSWITGIDLRPGALNRVVETGLTDAQKVASLSIVGQEAQIEKAEEYLTFIHPKPWVADEGSSSGS